ncbi:MAG: O-antigen ligase family protein, partial [Chloroflexota bacterium]
MSRSSIRPNGRRSPLIILIILFALAIVLLAAWAIVAWRSFAHRGIPTGLPEPISQSEFQAGINVNLGQYTARALPETLDQISAAGFRTLKQPFYYDDLFDWTASDRLVEAIVASDLTLVPLLDGDPDQGFAPPADLAEYAAWAGEFAMRYGDHVDRYIIWDEPNLASHWGNKPVNPAEYAALLSAAAEAIREADPSAVIVAAPLAPTVETGGMNLADPLYLQALYQAGAGDAFDVVAGKPYGFDSSPVDRRVQQDLLNFSRIILLREVMERFGDTQKPIWAANWGWNSLPETWQGEPSIWGQVDEEDQAQWTVTALERARSEWPWMGIMFLENWQPDEPPDDPHWGFSIAGRSTAEAVSDFLAGDELAYPGFHYSIPESAGQQYEGNWRFSPEFGADVGDTGDTVSLRFWGTDVGLRVRKGDYHARFYVTIDGRPANELPADDGGASLVLNAPDPLEAYLATEIVASDLAPGEHTLTVTAHRGTDQWSLNGFSVSYRPPDTTFNLVLIVLAVVAMILALLAIQQGRRTDWGSFGRQLSAGYRRMGERWQLLLTASAAVMATIAGWLTWSEQASGLFRRLGDGGQLALTAAAASTFYFTPTFLVYFAAVALLFGLIYLRPQWGLALVAFTIPFFVKPKPLLGYRFSPLEIFLLVAAAAFLLRLVVQRIATEVPRRVENPDFRLRSVDFAFFAFVIVATLSLFFSSRLDVATNEWRVLVMESAIFYLLLRWIWLHEGEMWTVLDAFVLGGVVVAVIGLWQYATGQNLITSEGGLMRLRSVYGSPNNVALFLGRTVPILIAVMLMGKGRRRMAYSLALLPIGLAMILSFSKGALFLGLPASLLAILILWRRSRPGPLWPWLLGFVLVGLVTFLVALQIPQLAGRLNPQGATGFFRMNLWQSSLNMFLEHPILGVGLDNFLYEYRGRYILDAAWREPNLSHPHNIFLDFATRLGVAGLVAGAWLFWSYLRIALGLPRRIVPHWY